MVLLLAGASHAGKTAFAQRLLETYGYPYLSIDHLKMGLIRSGNTALTPEDDEELTEYLWPIVREIVKTAVENRQNLIVEGGISPSAGRRIFPPSTFRTSGTAASSCQRGISAPISATSKNMPAS